MLIKCHECRRQISSEAAACPKCGAPVKKEVVARAIKEKKRSDVELILLGIIAIVIAVGYLTTKDKLPVASQSPQPAQKQAATVAPAARFGIDSADAVVKMVDMKTRGWIQIERTSSHVGIVKIFPDVWVCMMPDDKQLLCRTVGAAFASPGFAGAAAPTAVVLKDAVSKVVLADINMASGEIYLR